ncbi:MAG TPA: acyltransferase family protein, partial [Rubrobacteraceae bacterium]|nr:acyltransferase family protein [Rubrobacteraceae bacterium]
MPFYKQHEGKQYCVLHFPGKEKEADFQEALGKKLEDRDFDFAGVYFPGELNFNFLQFDSGTDFSEATFEEGAGFFKSTFKEGANFSRATFEGEANFLGATFEGRTNFSDATFKKKAGFFEASFEEEADFYQATFEEEAVFIKASFEKISRSRDDAPKEAVFSTATFEKEACFSGATFKKAAAQGVPRAFEADGRSGRATGGVRLPYLPGIDGLRALAVIAVLLYHAQLHWLPGGFLGVDIFFVISGYLIASLLLAEWRQRGRIDLKAFWLGRARRLLPALYLLLAVTLAFAVVFLPGEVARLRSDALAAFGYVTNWYLMLGQQSYFETIGRPSLLQHLWSLAVEEQFYLLWPLLFAAGMARLRWLRRRVPVTDAMTRWRSRRVLIAVIAGAAASAVLMATLYRPDVDPSRIYYGTDTRATALLVGVALAFVWAPGQSWRRTGWNVPLLLDVAGLAALGGLLFFCLWLDESQPLLFRGGFALVALTTAALIMVLVHPGARLMAGLLGQQPLRWIGLRSYSIYLWHWPVFMVTRPELDVPIAGLPLLALQLGATVVLADLSYRFVETPIRRGALGRAWRALREARGARRWQLGARWAGAVGTSVAFCMVLGLALVHAQPSAPPSYLSVEAIHTEASATTTETDAATAETASADPITAVGDSVMIGAAGELNRALDN